MSGRPRENTCSKQYKYVDIVEYNYLKMPNVFSTIQNTLTDSIRMSILHTTQKTSIYETVLYSILISVIMYFTQYTMDLTAPLSKYQDCIKSLFYRKYVLKIDGKTSTATTLYSGQMRVSNLYSDNFKAVWSYILKNIHQNRTIYEIRQVSNSSRIRIDDEMHDANDGMYIVSQRGKFLLDADLEIYAITNETNESTDERVIMRSNKIELTLYSYKSNTSELHNYVNQITAQYLLELSDSRIGKQFLYSLLKVDNPSESRTSSSWNESEFSSSKTFHNVFFDNKEKVLEQIDFFLKNREWYNKYGIPYTLGIGLYGPPGTGKTSFIKALMNHMKDRHLINMPLSLIKTKTQLNEYYYESRFTEDNKPNSVGFDKKIIVIEDIDCANEIVMERNNNPSNPPATPVVLPDEYCDITLNESVKVLDDAIKDKVKDNILTETRKIISKMVHSTEDKITLDDILNLWDGIRETPGRILVITSNHYNKLDTAIRRPGRIDITLGFENATHNTISEMFTHFYGKPIDPERLSKIHPKLYSPAEIVNIYSSYKNDETGFIERLSTNQKLHI